MRVYSESRFDGDDVYSWRLLSSAAVVADLRRIHKLGEKSRMEAVQEKRESEVDHLNNGLDTGDSIPLTGNYSLYQLGSGTG